MLEVSAAFGASDQAAKNALKAAGFSHVVIQAGWPLLQNAAGGALDATGVANLQAQFDQAAAAGLKVVFECAVQYLPGFASANIPKLKDQNGNLWSSANPGADIRDFVWSPLARTYLYDFIQKTFAALTATQKALITHVRIGSLYYGELHFPPPSGAAQWWGYSADAQATCPVPGWIPFPASNGDANKDLLFTRWYEDSLIAYKDFLVRAHRDAGYHGKLYILMPGFGQPNGVVYGSSVWQAQESELGSWPRLADSLQQNVGLWSTWIDNNDPDVTNTQWYRLAVLARAKFAANSAAGAVVVGSSSQNSLPMLGENTGGQTAADIDRLFGPNGAVKKGGYRGVTWLDYPALAANGGALLTQLGNYAKKA